MRALIIALTLLFAAPAYAVGVDSVVLEDPLKEAEAQEIMGQLRCLVCQNQSIVDSDAPLAADLRQIVRERVALGDDGTAVKGFLVERYGDWVLLSPPVKKSTYLLWFAPVAVLLFAVCVIVLARRSSGPTDLSDGEKAAADTLLKDGLK